MDNNLNFIKSETHLTLVKTAVSHTFQDNRVSGLMLTGSVARGDAYPSSDLDLYILLKNGHVRKFHSEVKENILIEYKYANFEQVQLN